MNQFAGLCVAVAVIRWVDVFAPIGDPRPTAIASTIFAVVVVLAALACTHVKPRRI